MKRRISKNKTRSFQENYAQYYDLLYADKNYVREVDFLEELFDRYAAKKPQQILDLACGTGNHALLLAGRGYTVTGLDSSKGMISLAREKARERKVPLTFRQGSMEKLSLNKVFDVIFCLFNAIDYLLTLENLFATLRRIRKHLKKGGLSLFDFRSGFASLDIEAIRVKEVKKKGEQLIRISENSIDPISQLFTTKYTCLVLSIDQQPRRFTETHTLRFYFPQEMRHYLEDYGFSTLLLSPFLKINKSLSKEDFNLMVVAK